MSSLSFINQFVRCFVPAYGGFKKVCAFNQQQIGGSGLSGRDWARASERVRKEEKRV